MQRNLRDIKEGWNEAGPGVCSIFGIDDAIMLAIGGGSIISDILGKQKQAKLAKQQMAQQQLLSNRQLDLSEDQARMGKAGEIDQYGNQTVYDPVTNTWKTQLSATGQQMSDAERNEGLRQLQVDAPMARGEAQVAAARRSGEGEIADTFGQQLRDQISGNTGYKASDIASSLRTNRTLAANAGMRQAIKGFNTNAIRTGMSAGAAGDALSTAGKNFADYSAQTMGNPDLEGINAAEELNSTKTNHLVDNYSAMASRATGSPGFQYTPNGMSSTLSQALAGSKSGALSGLNGAATTVANDARGLQGAYSLDKSMTPNYANDFSDLLSIYKSPAGQDLAGTLTTMYKKRSAAGG
jgi:hypothetical protein